MRTSEQIDQLATALAVAQGAFSNPAKDREVTVQTKAGGTYKFKYATFTAIVDSVRKPLADNGLSFLQITDADSQGALITTRLLHASGQWIQFDTPVFVASEGAQAFGSGITYAKRYALSTMLGITADEDDDGNRAEGNDVDMRTRTPGAPKPPARPAPPAQNARPAISANTNDEAAETFAAQSVEAVGKFRHREAQAAWWRDNKKHLDRLEAKYPKLFERVFAAYEEAGLNLPSVTQAAE